MIKVLSYEDCFAFYPDTKVINAKYYGAYQGEFLCKIEHKGEILYIHDWYGSCSACDQFEADFSYLDSKSYDEKKVLDFAKPYIESAMTKDQLISMLEKSIGEWDEEKKEMLADVLAGF